LVGHGPARLGLDGDRVEEVRIAALLHDVGKVGVSDAVLQKAGPLSAAQWTEMRRHPEIGANLLTHPGLAEIREWVLRHHERPDGRGYPDGLRGAEIPVEALIVGVADAYEAMTADRPYRAAVSARRARSQLEGGRGSQFDERVLDAFLACFDEGLPGPSNHAPQEVDLIGRRCHDRAQEHGVRERLVGRRLGRHADGVPDAPHNGHERGYHGPEPDRS
jgi:HD-GYP domain-containing protein (c-di-GMP phosphodiesterase class II)